MSNEQCDPVKEARGLLASRDTNFISIDCRFGDHDECQDRDCWCDHHERLENCAPELLKTLCDELDEARAELKERRKEVLDLEDEVSKNHA